MGPSVSHEEANIFLPVVFGASMCLSSHAGGFLSPHPLPVFRARGGFLFIFHSAASFRDFAKSCVFNGSDRGRKKRKKKKGEKKSERAADGGAK